jgi:hypothetical protein
METLRKLGCELKLTQDRIFEMMMMIIIIIFLLVG